LLLVNDVVVVLLLKQGAFLVFGLYPHVEHIRNTEEQQEKDQQKYRE
jgi:hypothetical protein